MRAYRVADNFITVLLISTPVSCKLSCIVPAAVASDSISVGLCYRNRITCSSQEKRL